MLAPRLAIPALSVALVLVSALALTPIAHAQEATPPRPRSSLAGSVSLGGTGVPWGTRAEHWLAAGLGIALGAATVAVGTGLQRYAIDTNTHALAATTTQADAASSVNTARDFLLAAEVMWAIGASLTAIGLTWVIVLSFSTPVQATDPAAAPAAPAPSAAIHVTPFGITLEGVF